MSTQKRKTPPAAKSKAKARTVKKADINTKNKEIKMTAHKTEKLAADASAMNKEQMDAFMQSGNLWVSGSEEIIKTCVSLTQQAMEKNSEAVKTLMGCKTLNELSEAQSKLAQESFDDLVANATKLSELSVKIATTTLEPINGQFSKTVKKATSAAA